MNLKYLIENIEYAKGDDIIVPFSIDDCSTGAEVPVDISAWTVECLAADMDDVAISGITVTSLSAFVRKIKIPRTQTASDRRHMATYKIVCTDSDGNRRTYYKGALIQND